MNNSITLGIGVGIALFVVFWKSTGSFISGAGIGLAVGVAVALTMKEEDKDAANSDESGDTD